MNASDRYDLLIGLWLAIVIFLLVLDQNPFTKSQRE